MSGPRTPLSLFCPWLHDPTHSAVVAELSGRLGSLDRAYERLDRQRERERQALAGETGDEPIDARPSGEMAVFDAIAKVGELEAMALCRYVCCGQAALELVATGATPVSWSEPLPGERPRVDGAGKPLLPEPGEAPGDFRVPQALTEVPGVDLLHVALRQFAALAAAHQEWEDTFGCNEWCDDREEGCGGGPHIPEHMIEEAGEIEREMDRAPEYLADYADAAAWTLTHGLRDRLQGGLAGAQGPRGGDC